ncbi:ISNCY family transposase, partial [Klebsiella pneumoniae]|nr:ISNCY family transposase [Klebsiella pneumoniae]
ELLLTGLATESQVQALMHYLVQAGNTREPIKFIRELAQLLDKLSELLLTGLATESQVQALMHYLVQAGNTRE